MASSGRGSNLASMRKKRRTIGGFRAQAMGDSFDHNSNSITADASANYSLSIVPENQLSCLGGETAPLSPGSEHIVVAVRVRPLSATEIGEGKRSCCDVLTRNTLVIRKGADPGAYLRSQKGSANEYSFDAVFPPEAGQSEVYEGTAKPHIAELLKGINVTVFAYGATGAGKTHTMMGSERVVGAQASGADGNAVEVSGIVPQSLVELFRLLDERSEVGGGEEGETETWKVRVSYLQVYNEQIMDLLSASSKPLKINEDPAKGVVVVAGLAEVEVGSSDEVLDLLRQGNTNRRTEATGANQVSSRSHAVLQVMVTRTLEAEVSGSKSIRESKLSLIDLAGSERASATNNRGEQLRQGANINKSLLSLANCINALAGNRRRKGGKSVGNVKYRDSKLTHLLKASLEGRCRLIMIANVNPSHVFFDDSHNTLKYANRAKNIKIDPRMTESVREASRLMTEKEAKMAREYQALKERNQIMEAQLDSMRNSRGYIVPEPAGFTDLFAPNTSSIMSVASSTPGYTERYGGNGAPPPPPPQQQQQQQLLAVAPGSAAAAAAPSRVGVAGADNGGRARARRSGGGGIDGTLPPPVPRGGSGGGSSGGGGVKGDERRMSEEGLVDSGEDYGNMASPSGLRLGGGGGRLMSSSSSSSPPPPPSSSGSRRSSSSSNRKRSIEERDGDGGAEVLAVKAAAAAAAAAADEKIGELTRLLATEKTRVCELEGKVRELESSMARMGAQHDVNMELIGTFRDQKDAAEEAAECERATADELLALLKEKETEVSQLRSELDETSRLCVSGLAGGSRGSSQNADARGDVSDEGDIAAAADRGGQGGTGGPRSRPMTEGDGSSLAPLVHIEESVGGGMDGMGVVDAGDGGDGDGGGGGDDDDDDTSLQKPGRVICGSTSNYADTSRGGSSTAGRTITETASASPSLPVTSMEIASVIKSNRRKSSLIPRSRKSMIPAPRSSSRSVSSRRLGDVTNSASTRLNDHLNSSSSVSNIKSNASRSGSTNPCDASKKGPKVRTAPVHGGEESAVVGANDDAFEMNVGGTAEAGRTRAVTRRLPSRTGQTPLRQTVAGRTRSRVSMASASSLREVR